MSYNSNYHSVFDINYHMIFCIKYRREVINDEISNRLKEIFEKICPKYNIVLKEWEHDINHIHMLINAMPNTELSKFVNIYKSASSMLIKKEFPMSHYFFYGFKCLIQIILFIIFQIGRAHV